MADDFAKNYLHSVCQSDIASTVFGGVNVVPMNRLSVRILITAFVLMLGTQVLFGQVLCDLQTSMPCCPSSQDSQIPPAPATGTDCCVISAPETGNHFTVDPKAGSDLSDLKALPTREEGLDPYPAVSDSVEFISCYSLLCPYDSPEKLSVFRI